MLGVSVAKFEYDRDFSCVARHKVPMAYSSLVDSDQIAQ
jgi:hypothetical protein